MCVGKTYHIHDAQNNSQLHREEHPFSSTLLLHVEVGCVFTHQIFFLQRERHQLAYDRWHRHTILINTSSMPHLADIPRSRKASAFWGCFALLYSFLKIPALLSVTLAGQVVSSMPSKGADCLSLEEAGRTPGSVHGCGVLHSLCTHHNGRLRQLAASESVFTRSTKLACAYMRLVLCLIDPFRSRTNVLTTASIGRELQ